MEPKSHQGAKSLLSNDYRSNGAQFSKESIQRRKAKEEDFLSQELDYRKFVFAPEGYEGVMLFLYILILPYLVGLSFLFLFIARASYESFLAFNLSSFFVIWAIGYEVSTVLIIMIIFLAWLNHYRSRYAREKTRQNNQSKKRY
ncbi:MAG TPA: hypothetical protein VFX68_09945 [Sulfuricurvum sp.]|nr:hypothetical protein [Sulfuricurvum sp.]